MNVGAVPELCFTAFACAICKKEKNFSEQASDPGLADGRSWSDEKDRVPSLAFLPVA